MRIGIVGAGNVGAALGKAWIKAGHNVRWGVRNANDPRYGALGRSRLTDPVTAAADAEAVILALPWKSTIEAVRGLGNLAGKIVIDCSNPLTMGAGGPELAVGFSSSAGEMVAEIATGAFVFKALNQTGAETMGDARKFERPPAMFVAGDDAERKKAVLGLVADLGFEALDAGPLRNARLLEPYAMLWIDQAFRRGQGRKFAFTIERRE